MFLCCALQHIAYIIEAYFYFISFSQQIDSTTEEGSPGIVKSWASEYLKRTNRYGFGSESGFIVGGPSDRSRFIYLCPILHHLCCMQPIWTTFWSSFCKSQMSCTSYHCNRNLIMKRANASGFLVQKTAWNSITHWIRHRRILMTFCKFNFLKRKK
jgi:hypothetical protein